jgi:hypothetical protein
MIKIILAVLVLFCYTIPAIADDEEGAAPQSPKKVVNYAKVFAEESEEDAEFPVPAEFLLECDTADMSCPRHVWSGYVALEPRIFLNKASYPGQSRNNAAVVFQPEYYYEWPTGRNFVMVPFMVIDSSDADRSSFDLREFYHLWIKDSWEYGIGLRKIFWGVTETQQLVDIVNQTDAAYSSSSESKLGQPMISISGALDSGTYDFYLMPYFRERTFPGRDGRLRPMYHINTHITKFESSAKHTNLDFAFRYSHSKGDWDYAISHFKGTAREPELRPNPNGSAELYPYYALLTQTGIELQRVAGEYLLKLEAISHSKSNDSHIALTAGFEYTLSGILDSSIDCIFISEWVYDDRGYRSAALDNDLMVGFRLSFNDVAGTELSYGLIKDLNHTPAMINFDYNRRLTDNWKINIGANIFHKQGPADPMYQLRNDDFINLKLSYYF